MIAWLLLLAACERDPELLGYWEVVSLRAGSTVDDLAEVTLAGTMEFTADSECYTMFAYGWSGEWRPDPTPELLVLGTDIDPNPDFIESYKEDGETYTVTLSPTYSIEQAVTFDLLDWKGSSVTLSSKKAYPPGVWGAGGGSQMVVEMDLER